VEEVAPVMGRYQSMGVVFFANVGLELSHGLLGSLLLPRIFGNVLRCRVSFIEFYKEF